MKFLFLLFVLTVNAHQKSDFFKVPREKSNLEDRPSRLVDNDADPDMKKLKKIQNQFFKVISNTSISNEFTGFKQLLDVVDSEAGPEMAQLVMNGVMIGMQKDNSADLLLEFFDDFKYYVPYEFIEAVGDYSDFMKNVDFSLIPASIEMLFKKDHLGNSLAQMPIGQLVDLIQPEVAKYGIDIREFINGILGKGDTQFPLMLKKVMQNFNASSMLKFVASSLNSDSVGVKKSGKKTDNSLDQIEGMMQLFKPFVANYLKDNEVDLDPDAVIQVAVPFVKLIGDTVSKYTDGESNFNIAMLAPLLGMLNSNSGKGNDMGNVLSSVIGAFSGNDNIGPLINIASQFMTKNVKNTQKKKKEPEMEKIDNFVDHIQGENGGNLANTLSNLGKNFDANKLMGVAVSLMENIAKDEKSGKDFKKGQDPISQIMGAIGGSGGDLGPLINMASMLMAGQNSQNKDAQNKGTGMENMLSLAQFLHGENGAELIDKLSNIMEPTSGKLDQSKLWDVAASVMENIGEQSKKSCSANTQKTNRQKNGEKVLEDIIKQIKTNKDVRKSIRDIIKKMKEATKQMQQKGKAEEVIKKMIGQEVPESVDLDAMEQMFKYSYADWKEFFGTFGNKDLREEVLLRAASPAADFIQMFMDQKFEDDVKSQFREFTNSLGTVGISGVDLNNFPEKLTPMFNIMMTNMDVNFDIDASLKTSQSLIIDGIAWYTKNSKKVREMPKHKFTKLVADSADDIALLPLREIWNAYEKGQGNKKCLPRVLCEVILKEEDDDDESISYKEMATRAMSLGFGVAAAVDPLDVNLMGDIVRVAFTTECSCEEQYPVTCPDHPASSKSTREEL